MARLGLPVAGAVALCACSVAVAAQTVEIPHPQPKPRFDHAKIDRTLKEPLYLSDKPAYRFFTFGPEGRSILAMVADESKGTGTGYDTLYADLNANRDLTEPAERFPLKTANKVKRRLGKGFVIFRLAGWGTTVVPERLLHIPDPKLTYRLFAGSGFVRVTTVLKDKSWGFPMRVMDDTVPWGTERATAPVIRFGGDEFTFANANFARRAGKPVDPGAVTKTIKPGDNIYIDGTAPGFYGSSPEVRLGRNGGVYCPWTDRNISAWIQSTEEKGRELVRIPFYPSCGGAYWGSILANTHYPHGKAALVLAMDSRGYLGTVVQRIPFLVDNPRYGKPVEELPITRRLKAEHPGAAVLELYQDVPLPKLGIPKYDGVRDVYFGQYGKHSGFGQSCHNLGIGLSYGRELRYELHLGGEGRRTLIKYDLSMLAPGVKVKRAVLALYVRKLNKTVNLDCRAFALKKRWSEKRIDYAHAAKGLPGRRARFPVGAPERWEKRMFQGESDRHAEPVGSLTFKNTGWTEVDVTPAVQKWVGGEWPNHGLGLEMVQERIVNGAVDVLMVASDYAVDPARRPRLILVLDGTPQPADWTVEERNADLPAARAKAKAKKKLVLVHLLSAGSLTSRAFESRLLRDMPAVKAYIDRHFVEARLNAENPKYRDFLKQHGVRHLPSAVVLPGEPKDPANFATIQPLDWDAMFGVMRSGFEFEQVYTNELQRVLHRAKRTQGRLRPSGTEVGGCGAGSFRL